MRPYGVNWMQRTARLLAGASLAMLPLLAQAASEDDPWESVNRPIFVFNDTLDTYALKPLAQGYQKVTPNFVQDGVHNFFSNIGDVRNLVNDLLQGKLEHAGVDTSRLLFNTTFGLAGFIDVATRMGLQRNDEDFGQTLGYWGLGSGPYVMLPLLGPSTLRDAPSKIPDAYTGMYPYIDDVSVRNSIRAVDVVDTRADLLKSEKLISGDKYTFIRNAYLQNREFKVKDGQVEDDF
ncbi:phospholipid-binding lipoprotein MlaA [Pseudomonas delhiensis]|uniref:Phospholipid-binding lipoprotein MlaA n=1 Tax=Pseudomonas delhiensis TaxID=366289 RepID=A0A239JSX3_9PSED|nr:VacJ family lipoprotein [Pseudomonas delhiensis]SDJ97425.1 phospholipid-binding lipoprotein MlaA [Pseudomonas delhiensis]SNT08652.1 phospholipid-binding lipoprotein MlaA [Pseudomonas delhiensis]